MQHSLIGNVTPSLVASLIACFAVMSGVNAQSSAATSVTKTTVLRTLSSGQDVVLNGQLLTVPVSIFGYSYRALDGASPERVSIRLDDGSGTPVDIGASRFDEPQAVLSYATDADDVLTSATAGPLTNAGWVATISPATLKSGDYRVSAVVMNFGAVNDVVTQLPSGTNRFTVASNMAATAMTQVSLKSTGAISPLFESGVLPSGVARFSENGTEGLTASVGLAAASGGRYRLNGYPALPSGDYVVLVPSANKYGRTSQAYAPLGFTYTRPVVAVSSFVATSAADNVEVALPSTTVIPNSATGEPLAGSMTARSGTALDVRTIDVAYDSATRRYVVPAMLPAPIGATPGPTRLWVQHPDAPDLAITASAWDFSETMKPGWNIGRTITADIETASFPVAFDSRKRGPCVGMGTFTQTTGQSNVIDAATVNGGANLRDNSMLCALRWNAPNPSLTAVASPVLTGTLPLSANGTTLGYTLGILNRNAQGSLNFISLIDKSVPLSVVDQTAPTASFKQDPYLLATLRSGGSTSLVTYAGPAKNAGTFYLQSGLTTPFTTHIVGTASTTNSNSSRGSIAMSVFTNQPVVGATQRVTIEAWWPQTPSRKHTYDLDFTAIPGDPTTQLLLASPTLTTAPTTFTGVFGLNLGRGVYAYDANSSGTWAIKLQRQNRDGTWRDVGQGVSTEAVSAAGVLSITTSSALPLGRWNFRTIASITGGGTYTKTVTSGNFQSDIHDGTIISGVVAASPSVAPASVTRPATILARLTLDQPIRSRDIKAVQWQRSTDDGATWSDVTGNTSSFQQYVTASGEYQFRAKISSRYVVDEFITQPTTVTIFTPPSIDISGPKSLIAGQPAAQYTVTTDASQGLINLQWHIARIGAPVSEAPITGSGTEVSFAPTIAGSYAVKVSATQQDAPTNDLRATTSETYAVYVTAPKPPAGRISPKLAMPSYEVGRPYDFLATLPQLTGVISELSTHLRQAWILPDGSTVAATAAPQPIMFPTEAQRTVSLKTWFNGFESDASFVSFVAPTWTYSFPQFTMTSRLLNTLEAPALIDLTLAATGVLRVDSGTVLNVVWTVPPGAGTVVSSSGLTARISLTTAGLQTITADIKDARNGLRTASAQFTISPTKDFTMGFGTASMDDGTGRAPLLVSMPLRVISLPRDDQLLSVSWTINGMDAGTGPVQLGTGKQLTLTTPGLNTIGAAFTTTKGRTTSISQEVNVTTGAAPVCTIARLASGTNLLALEARCTVLNGRVARYEWRNSAVQGAPSISLAQRFSLSLPSTLAAIYLKACPDRGPCTDVSYNVTGP